MSTLVKKAAFDPIRLRFNLNKRDINDGFALLGFGPFNSGKTHLMGDFLAEQSKTGPVMFLDIAGEKGSLSVANFDLGEQGYKVETYNDMMDLLRWARVNDIAGIGVDSLQTWVPLVCKHMFGDTRLPEEPAEWNKFHRKMKDSIDLIKAACDWIFCTCSAAIEVDPDEKVKTGQTKPFIAPDLPGKQARVIIGNFDMAGYLQVSRVAKVTTRKFVVDSPGKLLVRQRLPRSITEPIIIPHERGGWLAIRHEIEEALKAPELPEAKKVVLKPKQGGK